MTFEFFHSKNRGLIGLAIAATVLAGGTSIYALSKFGQTSKPVVSAAAIASTPQK